ncbi:ABC transporter permease subunit [bacterium]|nr:ABC transporter permease subunit [bacterium]
MVLSIALKEFYNNLVSARFAIGFLLCLGLIPLTLVVGIGEWESQVTAYETQRAEAEKKLDIRVWSQLQPRVVRAPEPLSILARGLSSRLGRYVDISFTAKPFKAEGAAAAGDNPLLSTYLSMDFITVLAVVLSLLALLFTYDSASGEREQGTLKLVLANSIPRHSVLLGKVLGGCLTILPILLFCYLLCALAITLSPSVAFTADDWLRLCLIVLASILYFAVFAFMGLLVSSTVRNSAAGLVVCLLAWVFFLFVAPNAAGFLASSLVETPSEKVLATATWDFTKEQWRKADELRGKEPEEVYEWENVRREQNGAVELKGANAAYMEWYRQGNRAVYEYMLASAETLWQMEKDFLDRQDRQRRLAERLSMVSPSQVFILLCNSLCRTDVESYRRFLERASGYREELIQFLRDKDLFDSYRFFTAVPPEKMLTTDQFIELGTGGKLKSMAEMRQWRKDNPEKSWSFMHSAFPPMAESDILPPLDLSSTPAWRDTPGGLALSLRDSLVKLVLLIATGLVLFQLAFIGFLRADVR